MELGLVVVVRLLLVLVTICCGGGHSPHEMQIVMVGGATVDGRGSWLWPPLPSLRSLVPWGHGEVCGSGGWLSSLHLPLPP
jgi:hypothetical protein